MSELKKHVLVVDDKREMADMVAEALADEGYNVTPTSSPRKALEMLAAGGFDALVTDLRMPDVDGLALLTASRQSDPDRPVIVMTGYGAIETAIESIRRGAFHYLTKPFKNEELFLFLGRALEQVELRREAASLRRRLHEGGKHATLLGNSKATLELVDRIRRVADTATPVLLLGETGTGKGLAARALHEGSTRREGPFVTINCAAIPEALLESELFGHVRGAFTGAVSNKPGLFAEAHGGTLFLDEIGDMPLSLQAKVLDVLGRGVVRPVGSSKERAFDVRIVAATHRDLRERVRVETFREDLFFRLSVVTLEMPPLRKRPEDILLFIDHFFAMFKAQHPSSPATHVGRSAVQRLLEYGWPGNVRQLAHTLERAVVLAQTEEVTVGDLPEDVATGVRSGELTFRGDVLPLRDVQRRYAMWAYRELGNHRGRAADRLAIDPKTLHKLLDDPTTDSQ